MPIAPGTKPKPAEVASGIHDVEPTVMVYQSAVRDPDLLITCGQLPIEGPSYGTLPLWPSSGGEPSDPEVVGETSWRNVWRNPQDLELSGSA